MHFFFTLIGLLCSFFSAYATDNHSYMPAPIITTSPEMYLHGAYNVNPEQLKMIKTMVEKFVNEKNPKIKDMMKIGLRSLENNSLPKNAKIPKELQEERLGGLSHSIIAQHELGMAVLANKDDSYALNSFFHAGKVSKIEKEGFAESQYQAALLAHKYEKKEKTIEFLEHAVQPRHFQMLDTQTGNVYQYVYHHLPALFWLAAIYKKNPQLLTDPQKHSIVQLADWLNTPHYFSRY